MPRGQPALSFNLEALRQFLEAAAAFLKLLGIELRTHASSESEVFITLRAAAPQRGESRHVEQHQAVPPVQVIDPPPAPPQPGARLPHGTGHKPAPPVPEVQLPAARRPNVGAGPARRTSTEQPGAGPAPRTSTEQPAEHAGQDDDDDVEQE